MQMRSALPTHVRPPAGHATVLGHPFYFGRQHFNGYTDSDDDSDYDDLPDLMDPDDEPTTDMFHSIDYFKYCFLYPLQPTPLYE